MRVLVKIERPRRVGLPVTTEGCCLTGGLAGTANLIGMIVGVTGIDR